MTHCTEGGSLHAMPSHPFLAGPFSWEASMDWANQNQTQKYLSKAFSLLHLKLSYYSHRLKACFELRSSFIS